VLTQGQAVSQQQQIAFRVIDDPAVTNAGSPKFSKRKMLMFSGAASAVSLGYIAVFLLVATELDHTLRNAGDVRHRLHLPVLDVIPDYSPKARARFRKRTKGRGATPVRAPAH